MIAGKSVEKHPMITPGEYSGLWSAYYVEIIFANGKKSGKIKMHHGVRGINVKCNVKVDEVGTVIAI